MIETIMIWILSLITTCIYFRHVIKETKRINNINCLRDTGKTLDELERGWDNDRKI